MARWKPMQIVGGSYADDALPWTHQDTVNYIPVPAEKEGVRSSAILRGVPGFSTFCDLGTNAPIRGMRNVEGRLFVVSGSTLFLVKPDGSHTSLGTIPGVSRCSLSHNQITGGNEVVISNGQAGYIYNTAANTFAQITDEAFIGAISFDFVDGYILGIEPARRFAFTSDLADAGSYSSLDRYEAEGSPDLLVGQAVTHREWWLMGERTIEPFTNTGDAEGTFQRTQGTVIEVGLAATHAVAVMDNSVFWLGSDGIVYRANGYTPQRISTHAIEQAISRCTLAKAFAFTFEDRGHKVFYLTFQDGQTWGYDAATGEWHRRESYGLNRWRVNSLVKWNSRWIAGDYTNGHIYQLDWDVQHEDGASLERRRITGVTHDNQNALIIDGIELVVDTGVASNPKWLAPLTITGDLPDGYVGKSVSPLQYQASRGGPGRVFSIDSGALPDGLSLSNSGVVTGTITGAAKTYSWKVRATDLDGSTATLNDTCVVTDKAWLASYQNAAFAGALAQGGFASGWPTTAAIGQYGRLYRDGSNLYVSRNGVGNNVSVSSDGGVTWSSTGTTGSMSTGSGRMAFLQGYQFLCGGVNVLKRRSTGAWSEPSASNSSRANSIAVVGNKIVVASIYATTVSTSSDLGLTWAAGSNAFGASDSPPLLATDGSRLIVFLCDSGPSNAHIRYSDDGGDTWSATAYTFPTGAAPSDLAWTGHHFIACTSGGQVATSSDGASWSLSASTIGVCNQIAVGGGQVRAACNGGLIYVSNDEGVTWASLAAPSNTGGNAINGIAWAH